MHQSGDMHLSCAREYMEKTMQASAEAGRTYSFSKSEVKVADFDLNINSINKITFNIGGFFGGYRSYVVEISDNINAYTKLWEDVESHVLFDHENEELFTKDTFLAALSDLHIGEWRRRYSTQRFEYTVCDGTQ